MFIYIFNCMDAYLLVSCRLYTANIVWCIVIVLSAYIILRCTLIHYVSYHHRLQQRICNITLTRHSQPIQIIITYIMKYMKEYITNM